MGSPGMFEEIKKAWRDNKSDVSSVVDDIHGARNISNHFRNIYEQLYNEQGDISNTVITTIKEKVANEVQGAHAAIGLVTADLVRLGIKKLKPDKADVSGDFTSDCLRAAPDIFCEKLAMET